MEFIILALMLGISVIASAVVYNYVWLPKYRQMKIKAEAARKLASEADKEWGRQRQLAVDSEYEQRHLQQRALKKKPTIRTRKPNTKTDSTRNKTDDSIRIDGVTRSNAKRKTVKTTTRTRRTRVETKVQSDNTDVRKKRTTSSSKPKDRTVGRL